MSQLVGVVMGGVELHPQNWARSAGKVVTYNLLQDVQHDLRSNKWPMTDILSGEAPPPNTPKMATPKPPPNTQYGHP